MNRLLTANQRAFIRIAVESGLLPNEDAAIQEALALWEDRERQRAQFLATLDDARASLASGLGRPITPESMRGLADEIKSAGRARLAEKLARSV